MTHKQQAAEEEDAEEAAVVVAAAAREKKRQKKKEAKAAAAAAKEAEANLPPSSSPSLTSSLPTITAAAARPMPSQFSPFPALDWLATANHLNLLASLGYFVLNSSRILVGDDISTVITASLSNSNMLSLGLLFIAAALCYCVDVQSFPAHWTRRMCLNPIRKREARREEEESDDNELDHPAKPASYQPPSLPLALGDSSSTEEQQQSPEQHAGRVAVNSPSFPSSPSRSSASCATASAASISVVVSSSVDLDHSLAAGAGPSRSTRRSGRCSRCPRPWRWRVEAWVVSLDLLGALLSGSSSVLPFGLSSLLARGATTSYDSVPVSIAVVDLLAMGAWTLSATLAFHVWRRDKIQLAREAWERDQERLEHMQKRIESIDKPQAQAQAQAAAATDLSKLLIKPASSSTTSMSSSSSSFRDRDRVLAPHSDSDSHSRLWLDPFDLGWWSAALNLAASVLYLAACVYGLHLSLAVQQHVVEARRKTADNRNNNNGGHNNGHGKGSSSLFRWALVGAEPNPGGGGGHGGQSTWQPAVSIGLTPQQIQAWVHLQRKLNVVGDSLYLLCAIFSELAYIQETHQEINQEKEEQARNSIHAANAAAVGTPSSSR